MFYAAGKMFLTTVNSKRSSYLLLKHVKNCVYFQRDHYNKPVLKDGPRGSKYCKPNMTEVAEEGILSFLKDKKYLSREEWNDFKENLIEYKELISEDNFGIVVLNVLISSNQLSLGHSLIDYLEQSPAKPNPLAYLKYMSLCSNNYRHVDQKLFLKLIDKVKAHIDCSPILDNKRAEYFIQGLCATEKWKDSLKYLNKLINSKPTREMCNSLACAAVRNGDEVLAWKILTKWMSSYDVIDDKVIEEFLLEALKMQKLSCLNSDSFILKLFNYMQERNIIVSLGIVKLIEQYFKSHRLKWKITRTKVSRKGICTSCETSLPPLSLDDGEFKILRDSFLERSVKKSDLYINTTSREFKNYMEFINVHKPFHIVLDGLNAAYSFPGTPNRKALASHLLKIVHLLSGNSRKLLVLGRKHMEFSWPKYHLLKISQKAQLFFTDNISEDDPFVIYAALASGPHTYFLSDDLMRDHLSRLHDPKLIYLFKKWQLSHQVHMKCNETDINFIEPVKHDIAIQGGMENGWHIPFDDKIILDPYEELNNWLCIKRVE